MYNDFLCVMPFLYVQRSMFLIYKKFTSYNINLYFFFYAIISFLVSNTYHDTWTVHIADSNTSCAYHTSRNRTWGESFHGERIRCARLRWIRRRGKSTPRRVARIPRRRVVATWDTFSCDVDRRRIRWTSNRCNCGNQSKKNSKLLPPRVCKKYISLVITHCK